jgi:cell division protein ZapA (FtsZ GTPase activity inhibitor)
MQSIEVDIFGRKFRLRTDDPDRLERIVAEINTQLDELQKTFDTLDFTRLLLMLALQQQEKVDVLEDQTRERGTDLDMLNSMIGKIIGDE